MTRAEVAACKSLVWALERLTADDTHRIHTYASATALPHSWCSRCSAELAGEINVCNGCRREICNDCLRGERR